MSLRRIVLMFVVIFSIIAANLSAFAQTSKKIIAGIVRDKIGAVVSGAKVTLISQETSKTRSAVADEHGAYRIDALNTGQYTGRRFCDYQYAGRQCDAFCRDNIRSGARGWRSIAGRYKGNEFEYDQYREPEVVEHCEYGRAFEGSDLYIQPHSNTTDRTRRSDHGPKLWNKWHWRQLRAN
jgi:hypothetical protein